jgi:hypothetical protein
MFVAAGINARGVAACGQTEKRTGYPVTSVSSSPCRPGEGIKVSTARDERPSPAATPRCHRRDGIPTPSYHTLIHVLPGSHAGAKVRRTSFAWNYHGVP